MYLLPSRGPYCVGCFLLSANYSSTQDAAWAYERLTRLASHAATGGRSRAYAQRKAEGGIQNRKSIENSKSLSTLDDALVNRNCTPKGRYKSEKKSKTCLRGDILLSLDSSKYLSLLCQTGSSALANGLVPVERDRLSKAAHTQPRERGSERT